MTLQTDIYIYEYKRAIARVHRRHADDCCRPFRRQTLMGLNMDDTII